MKKLSDGSRERQRVQERNEAGLFREDDLVFFSALCPFLSFHARTPICGVSDRREPL